MSRAFIRESDSSSLPELPPLVSPLPPGAKNHLTPGGAQRLREELARRVEHERPRLVAAAADDVDAKRELQVLDQRIRYVQESLRTAEVAVISPGPAEVVSFGTTVTVREKDGSVAAYRIVGVDETDLDRNWVSWLSPLARALTHGRVGDRVHLKTPRGGRELEIISIVGES